MGDVKLVKHSPEIRGAVKAAKARALEIIGGKGETYAKMLCPVDTGRLRNSITHVQEDESTEIIGTNVEYAPYVDLGTVKQRAQPFLRPAAANHVAEYQRIWQIELNAAGSKDK